MEWKIQTLRVLWLIVPEPIDMLSEKYTALEILMYAWRTESAHVCFIGQSAFSKRPLDIYDPNSKTNTLPCARDGRTQRLKRKQRRSTTSFVDGGNLWALQRKKAGGP